MLRNYLKIAWRNLWKNKSASLINICGLSVGLTCCLLMVLYLQHELSYDRFQPNGNRIARVIMEYSFNGSPLKKGNFTSTKVLPAFRQNFPEVEDGVRMADPDRFVSYQDKLFLETKFLYADSAFFRIFDFPLTRGNRATALNAPNTVVITRATAKRYFGDGDPVGKAIQVGIDRTNYTITGVAEDCPSNSQIKFDFIASFVSLGTIQEKTYFDANYTTYLLLKDESSLASLQSKIGPFMKKEMAGDQGAYVNYQLEPYTRVHLYSPYDGFEANSNITYIYIIAGIALLILVIACITYINLSTSRSLERAREVGIRKVSGAVRTQVFWQFIGESMLITFISLLFSLVLVSLVLPAFNSLAEKELHFSDTWQAPILLSALLIVIVIGLIAGSYPALVLSRFRPVAVLKGSFRNSYSGTWMRHSLIVFQFTISLFLVVATIVVRGQLHYIQHKKLGYDRDHSIVMNIDQKVLEKMEVLKAAFKSNPKILAVSRANASPVNIVSGYRMRADAPGSKDINTRGNPIDDEYIEANGLQLVTGANFTARDVADIINEDESHRYYRFILNETAARSLGWSPADAVGKKMFLGDQRPGEVAGVVKDFHFASLRNPIEPLVMFPGDWGNVVLVRITGEDIPGTLSFLGSKWKEIVTHRPFDYRFMDDDFNKLYASELRTGRVFNIFAAIAVFLACLGLFGLSSYAARQRTKEIGVRKILGASVGRIVLLLSNSFIRLVAISILIACPLAWLAMSQWLQDFAYRIPITWWMFALAGGMVILIALLTVCIQAIKTAFANPVKSLRTE